VDTCTDLNAYAQIENQAGCCAPATALPVSEGCCGTAAGVHEGLAALLRKYNVNDYAASVQVYALKA
jgi:hypothetical protein